MSDAFRKGLQAQESSMHEFQEDDEELLEQVYGVERNEPCVYGHFDCAQFERGPCANETYSKLYARKHS